MKRLTDGLLRLNPAADDNPKLADFHQSLIYQAVEITYISYKSRQDK